MHKPAAWMLSASAAEQDAISNEGDERIVLRCADFRAEIRPTAGADVSFGPSSTATGVGRRAKAFRRGGAEADDRGILRHLGERATLFDRGFELDRYEPTHVATGHDLAVAGLLDVESSSALLGARKCVVVSAGFDLVAICYALPLRLQGFTVQIRTEPRGRNPARGAWVARNPFEPTWWIDRDGGPALETLDTHFHLLIGHGEATIDRIERLSSWVNSTIHADLGVAR